MNKLEYVLHESALLALLDGVDEMIPIADALPRSGISSVGYAALVETLLVRGHEEEDILTTLDLGFSVLPFNIDVAQCAARLALESRLYGLDFSGRACLATALVVPEEPAMILTATKWTVPRSFRTRILDVSAKNLANSEV